ncbi:peptide deformylase [Planoprotostelium fungivorum]|uniref:Peptide deformylase n=1 Tax=Planoprotostelium fungivorum TaxID=1890364 RepID=A0A2P6MTS7_9EUKA|nr:peptide deformylase [Planoprotostelium fungivorum]
MGLFAQALPLKFLGNPVLRQVAKPLSKKEIKSSSTRDLIKGMEKTVAKYEGVGLAAPQVGISKRVLLVVVPETSPPIPCTVMINPRLTDTAPSVDSIGTWEACLSIPGMFGFVPRRPNIQVDYLDEKGKPFRITASGFPAVVIQHEIDHLDGKLFLDHIKRDDLMCEEEWMSRNYDIDQGFGNWTKTELPESETSNFEYGPSN